VPGLVSEGTSPAGPLARYSCAVPSSSTPHPPHTYGAFAAAFEHAAEPRARPMAAAATTVYRNAPVIPARSRRRTPAPRASACGSLMRRPRQLRCEFVAVGGNGALSGEDDPRFVDRVRDSLASFALAVLALSFSFCSNKLCAVREDGSVSCPWWRIVSGDGIRGVSVEQSYVRH
jgi:hypothetical protein